MNTHFQKMINRMKTKQASRTKLFALSLCGVALAVLGSSQAYAVVICNPPPPISLTFRRWFLKVGRTARLLANLLPAAGEQP